MLRRLGEVVRAPHELVGVIVPDDADDPRSVLTQMQTTAQALRVRLEVVRSGAETRAALEQLRPDLAIVCGWYLRLPVEDTATRFYGLHASRLPAYRGFAPVVWQILEGRDEVGLSLFELTAGIDEGDVVAASSVPLGGEDTVGDALEGLERLSVAMVGDHLPDLLDGRAQPRPQDHAQATYRGPRSAEDGEIDWRLPARGIHDFVRAQTRPYPGAYTSLGDTCLRVWRTRVEPRAYGGVPGSVCERHPGAVVVACGDGAVQVLEAQVDGEAPASVEAILSSVTQRLGRRP